MSGRTVNTSYVGMTKVLLDNIIIPAILIIDLSYQLL